MLDGGYAGLLGQQVNITQREKGRARQLSEEEEAERLALKQREKAMQGGGRTGLMYSGNQQGVV